LSGTAFEQRQACAFVGRPAQADFDKLVAFAIPGDRHAGQRGLQEIRQILRRHAEHARALLIDVELDHFGRLLPVEVDVAQGRIPAHHVGDLARELAHRGDVGARDAELHRIADRRPVLQAHDACTQLIEVLVEQFDQVGAEFLAVGERARQQHELGEARLRQLLIEWQIEARRAVADEADVVLEFGALGQPRFEFFHLLLRRIERGAFGQLEVDHEFGSRRIGKELLLDQAEAGD
jgi:hypothetical protein